MYHLHMTTAKASAGLRYCERVLAEDLSAQRRQSVEAKAAEYRRHLAGHCARCGRTIAGPGPLGPECAKIAA